VRCRFTVETRSGVFVDEPDGPSLTVPVRRYRRLRGQVRIRSGLQPLVAPEDELVPLVTNLCFRAVVQVRTDEHETVRYTDTYGLLRLDHEGSTIRISGDRVPDVRVDATKLLHSLVDCGSRFRAWLPGVSLDDDLDAISAALAEEEDRARRTLQPD